MVDRWDGGIIRMSMLMSLLMSMLMSLLMSLLILMLIRPLTKVSRASVRESSITDRGLKYLLRHKVGNWAFVIVKTQTHTYAEIQNTTILR